jgi:hypothetical protein
MSESVHPVEGIKMQVSFMSEMRGAGRFPSGRNMGSGTMHQYPHGIVDAEYHGVVTTAASEQYFWWMHEKSRVSQDGKVRGLVIVTGFTTSQQLAWANNLIIAIDSVFDSVAQEFKGTGYEWK